MNHKQHQILTFHQGPPLPQTKLTPNKTHKKIDLNVSYFL